MEGLVSAPDHVHPDLAILDETHPKSLAGSVPRTGNLETPLVVEPVFHEIPGQLVGELESLDEPLTLQIAQVPLPQQEDRVVKAPKGFPEVREPPFPADVGVHTRSIAKRACMRC